MSCMNAVFKINVVKRNIWLNYLAPKEKKPFKDARKSANTWIMEEHKKYQADILAKKQKQRKEKQKKKEIVQQKEIDNNQGLV